MKSSALRTADALIDSGDLTAPGLATTRPASTTYEVERPCPTCNGSSDPTVGCADCDSEGTVTMRALAEELTEDEYARIRDGLRMSDMTAMLDLDDERASYGPGAGQSIEPALRAASDSRALVAYAQRGRRGRR